MQPVNPQSQKEEVVLYLQRKFRHHRYLKRVEEKGAPYQKKLYIRELGRSEFPILETVMNQWISQTDPDIAYLYDGISRNLRLPTTRFIIALDLYGELQGVAAFVKGYAQEIWVHYLVTHPQNLTDEKKWKGIGTALIENLIHTAMRTAELPRLIGLTSNLDSESFYKKLLFEETGELLFVFPREKRGEFMNQFSGRASPAPFMSCRRLTKSL